MAKNTLTPTDPPQLQIIGLCRFSYLGEGGFKTLHATLAERRAFLYHPRRLAHRMIWFEQVFLPAWRHQTNLEYRMVILLGEDFPAAYRARIEALTQHLPEFTLAFRPPMPHRDACDAVMREAIDPGAAVTAQFRLDDDDAVAVDYVATLRRDFAKLQDYMAAHGPMVVDYGRGIVLTDHGGRVEATPRIVQNWAAGLTLFLPKGHDRTVLDYPHHKVALKLPTLFVSDKLMFLRGEHSGNDSKIPREGTGFTLPPDRVAAVLRNRFQVDLAALEKALSDHHAG